MTRIFISHSSTQKPMIHAVREALPESMRLWIDNEHLAVGDALNRSLKEVIQSQSDYVLVFIDSASASSEWVRNEIAWTLAEERIRDRVILVPIVFNLDAWRSLPFPELRDRKFVNCCDFLPVSTAVIASRITNELFAFIWADLRRLRRPAESVHLQVVSDADAFLERVASKVLGLVFRHRRNNPMSLSALRDSLVACGTISDSSVAELDRIINRLCRDDMLPGVVYDGESLHVNEEHYKWKRSIASPQKTAIARAAMKEIKSGDVVALDSGSSTEALAVEICKAICSGALKKLSVVTNSVRAVQRFVEAGLSLGLEEDFSPFQVYVTGGFVRPNTLAIVGYPDPTEPEFAGILAGLGGGSIGFVGVNGVHCEAGFTTHTNAETHSKGAILAHCRKRVILGDSSKLGIVESEVFASLDDEVLFITNRDDKALAFQAECQRRRATMMLV